MLPSCPLRCGPENLVVCTAMSGAFLMAMGFTGLGAVIKYIPKPVRSSTGGEEEDMGRHGGVRRCLLAAMPLLVVMACVVFCRHRPLSH